MNYFHYFSEIEDRFQQLRQSGGFLLTPLDWALIESWKQSEIPLEAVLEGMDRAFEKWHKRKRKFGSVNSLAYCTQEVLETARQMAEGGAAEQARSHDSGFAGGEVEQYLRHQSVGRRLARRHRVRLRRLRSAAADLPAEPQHILRESADSLEALGAKALDDSEGAVLEEIEQRLSVIEKRIVAVLTQAQTEEDLFGLRQDMDRQLAPYRRKMTADQLSLLEKQYFERATLEAAGVPRLSLFYLN